MSTRRTRSRSNSLVGADANEVKRLHIELPSDLPPEALEKRESFQQLLGMVKGNDSSTKKLVEQAPKRSSRLRNGVSASKKKGQGQGRKEAPGPVLSAPALGEDVSGVAAFADPRFGAFNSSPGSGAAMIAQMPVNANAQFSPMSMPAFNKAMAEQTQAMYMMMQSPTSATYAGSPVATPQSAGRSPAATSAMTDEQKKTERLEKNRRAAKECRQKKKAYIQGLEERVKMLEAQNKSLMEELTNARSSLNPEERERLERRLAEMTK